MGKVLEMSTLGHCPRPSHMLSNINNTLIACSPLSMVANDQNAVIQLGVKSIIARDALRPRMITVLHTMCADVMLRLCKSIFMPILPKFRDETNHRAHKAGHFS